MNSTYAAFVTGVVSMRNAGTSTTCAGRSLSYAHGSVEVPITNSPAGTSTSGGSSAGSGPGAPGSVTGTRVRVVHELDGGQHRLDVLVLVVDHEAVDEPTREELVVGIEVGAGQHVE